MRRSIYWLLTIGIGLGLGIWILVFFTGGCGGGSTGGESTTTSTAPETTTTTTSSTTSSSTTTTTSTTSTSLSIISGMVLQGTQTFEYGTLWVKVATNEDFVGYILSSPAYHANIPAGKAFEVYSLPGSSLVFGKTYYIAAFLYVGVWDDPGNIPFMGKSSATRVKAGEYADGFLKALGGTPEAVTYEGSAMENINIPLNTDLGTP